jgi:hypothetical protein
VPLVAAALLTTITGLLLLIWVAAIYGFVTAVTTEFILAGLCFFLFWLLCRICSNWIYDEEDKGHFLVGRFLY